MNQLPTLLVSLIVAGAGSSPFASTLQPQAAAPFRGQVIREAQFRFGVPAPAPVIAGQIQQESAWNPNAKSRTGALGLMQFMPKTAEWAAIENGWGAVNATNPDWAIRAGVWYDKWLYDRSRANTDCDRWHFALASYNGGLGWTRKRQKLSTDPGSWEATGRINPGIADANQHENETYSDRILSRHQPRFTDWGRTVCLGDQT